MGASARSVIFFGPLAGDQAAGRFFPSAFCIDIDSALLLCALAFCIKGARLGYCCYDVDELMVKGGLRLLFRRY